MNALQQVHASAFKANDYIGDLIARIGTELYPSGYVQTAYRNALRALETALGEQNKLAAVNEVLDQLRRTIERETRSILADAQIFGVEEATRQMSFYTVNSTVPSDEAILMALLSENDSALDAVLSRVDNQIAVVRALVITNAENDQIVGDEDRKGVVKPSDVSGSASFWTTAVMWNAFSWHTTQSAGSVKFSKQAIAALDGRTTNCCLSVNGQVQKLKDPFHLTGTPRYADYIDWPAFHDYCRTAGALYLRDFDFGLTASLQAQSLSLLKP